MWSTCRRRQSLTHLTHTYSARTQGTLTRWEKWTKYSVIHHYLHAKARVYHAACIRNASWMQAIMRACRICARWYSSVSWLSFANQWGIYSYHGHKHIKPTFVFEREINVEYINLGINFAFLTYSASQLWCPHTFAHIAGDGWQRIEADPSKGFWCLLYMICRAL